MAIQVKPLAGGRVDFEMQAKALEVPFGAKFVLPDFSAKGYYQSGELVFNEFDARLFDGVLKGIGRLRSGGNWVFDGQIEARTLELNRIAPALFANGRMQGKARFAMTAATPDTLFSNPTLEGSFTSNAGQFSLGDLGRAMQSTSTLGGSTLFTDASGDIAYAAKRLLIKNVRFSASSLVGTAQMDVDEKSTLFGRIAGEMRTPGGTARGSFIVSGNVDKPSMKAATGGR